ncbi:hypothetical protein C8R42DRAFT_637531 [Lentinula raphanica]|nr:hypothetical protein C8R42DRAFT_637531 [Lentinula raphanica]
MSVKTRQKSPERRVTGIQFCKLEVVQRKNRRIRFNPAQVPPTESNSAIALVSHLYNFVFTGPLLPPEFGSVLSVVTALSGSPVRRFDSLHRLAVVLPLKSYEGLIGIKYTEERVFMTSPNMDVLTAPLLGPQTIFLRQQMHYGEHDPCLVAQPFSSQTPWLSVIQYPYADGYASAIPWVLPVKEEFEPIDGHKLAENPLGTIPVHYTTELNR